MTAEVTGDGADPDRVGASDPQRFTDVPGLGSSTRFGYAHAVRAGEVVFLAGQMGLDTDYQVVSPDFDAQARQTFTNIGHALAAAGAELRHLVSMTVYLTDMRHSERFFKIRDEMTGGLPVASTTVAVSGLPLPGLLVEVQATAVVQAGD